MSDDNEGFCVEFPRREQSGYLYPRGVCATSNVAERTNLAFWGWLRTFLKFANSAQLEKVAPPVYDLAQLTAIDRCGGTASYLCDTLSNLNFVILSLPNGTIFTAAVDRRSVTPMHIEVLGSHFGGSVMTALPRVLHNGRSYRDGAAVLLQTDGVANLHFAPRLLGGAPQPTDRDMYDELAKALNNAGRVGDACPLRVVQGDASSRTLHAIVDGLLVEGVQGLYDMMKVLRSIGDYECPKNLALIKRLHDYCLIEAGVDNPFCPLVLNAKEFYDKVDRLPCGCFPWRDALFDTTADAGCRLRYYRDDTSGFAAPFYVSRRSGEPAPTEEEWCSTSRSEEFRTVRAMFDKYFPEPLLLKEATYRLGAAIWEIGNRFKKVLVFYGDGNNGKSKMMKIINLGFPGVNWLHSAGENFYSTGKVTNADAATPGMTAAQGSRIAFVSDFPLGCDLDSSLIKRLSGEDEIVTRKLFCEQSPGKPATFTAVLLGQQYPRVDEKTQAAGGRLLGFKLPGRFLHAADLEKAQQGKDIYDQNGAPIEYDRRYVFKLHENVTPDPDTFENLSAQQRRAYVLAIQCMTAGWYGSLSAWEEENPNAVPCFDSPHSHKMIVQEEMEDSVLARTLMDAIKHVFEFSHTGSGAEWTMASGNIYKTFQSSQYKEFVGDFANTPQKRVTEALKTMGNRVSKADRHAGGGLPRTAQKPMHHYKGTDNLFFFVGLRPKPSTSQRIAAELQRGEGPSDFVPQAEDDCCLSDAPGSPSHSSPRLPLRSGPADDELDESEMNSPISLAQTAARFDAQLFFRPPTCTPPRLQLKVQVEGRKIEWLRGGVLGGNFLADLERRKGADHGWAEQQRCKITKFLEQTMEQHDGIAVVTETYGVPQSGFPGRLYGTGSQGIYRPIREHIYAGTADLDMSICMHRILLWICIVYQVQAPRLSEYVNDRVACLQRHMDETGATREAAKEKFQTPYTSMWPAARQGEYLCPLDQEAKKIQQELMGIPDLKWIVRYAQRSCEAKSPPSENVAGSFISHLFQFVEAKLLDAVRCKLTCERYKIEALLFDGLRIADRSGYFADAHSELAKSILETARIECEKVAPGIKMVWAWKAPDFTVANEAKQIVCSLESGQPAPLE